MAGVTEVKAVPYVCVAQSVWAYVRGRERVCRSEAGVFMGMEAVELLFAPKCRQHPGERNGKVRGMRVGYITGPVGFSEDCIELQHVIREERRRRYVDNILTVPPRLVFVL